MSERKAHKAWRLYLLLGVLSISGYFFIPSLATRDLTYDVVGNVWGLSTVAAALIGMKVYRPARPLPWQLFVVGLMLLLGGDVFLTVSDFMGTKLAFPTPADTLYLAFYPFMIAGMLMIGNSRMARGGPADVIDPLIVATSFGLLFWVYFMEPYVVEAYADNPSVTLVAILVAVAYPLMDLLLLVVLVRTLVVSSNRPVSYYLLGSALSILLTSDIVWMVAQAMGSRQIAPLVDLGFLLFFSLFGAAALHPSMATLFKPVPKVEAKLTRLRFTLLAGASLMAPTVLAVQAARGESINTPLFVLCSATLFLLVVIRLAGMMRAQEQAADRERILRRAGAALAASKDREGLHAATLDATHELLSSNPAARVSLRVGPAKRMEEVARTGKSTTAHFGLEDLSDEARKHFLEERSLRIAPTNSALAREMFGSDTKTAEVFIVPLRVRDEPTGAVVVAGPVPIPMESQNALETLGAEVALALENLQLLEEVRRTSVLKERQRLSHEIHDTLAQGFTSIVMSLSAAQLAHPEVFSSAGSAQKHLELAQRTARESLIETRRLVWALRPEALDRHSLPQALEKLAEEWAQKTGIDARFGIMGDAFQLLPETEVALLRIAQEALANVHKHAGAKRVVLTLSYLDDVVALDVSDDGVGFVRASNAGVQPQDVGGFGLVAMQERVEQLDGRLSIESTPGVGTTLAAELPTSQASSSHRRSDLEREAVEGAR